jgi:hypothetical protein
MNRLPVPAAYQRTESPDNGVLPGRDRSYLHRPLFGDGIAGKSFLQIGSDNGVFCLEALRRGASRAVGIEPYRENIDAARAVAAQFDLSPEFVEADFEEWTATEKFDVVACLNLFHRLSDPVHALRRIVAMANDKIVLEIAVPTFRDVRRGRIGAFTALIRKQPIIALGRPDNKSDSTPGTFMFTPAALEIILNKHYRCFEPVKIMRSPHKGRVIVEARKRTIETLTVVTGPVSAGKSTFIKRLVSDRALRGELSIPHEITAVATPKQISGLPNGPLRHVILEYSLLRPFSRGFRTYAQDPVASFIHQAREINFLTIMTPQDRLRQQRKPGSRRSAKHSKIFSLYETPHFLETLYETWYAHCARHASVKQHVIVENLGEYRFHPADRWRSIFAGLSGH